MMYARSSRKSLLRWCTCAAMALSALSLSSCKSEEKVPSYTPTQAAAEEEFERGANRPPSAETLFRLAKILAAQHKDAECETALRNCIDRYPDYMPAYEALAELQVRQRKFAAAQKTLNQGLALKPTEPVLLNAMGMSYMLTGDYDSALKYFKQASAAAPDDARYTSNVALATGMLGRYDESLSIYQSVLRPGPAHYNLAVVAEARKDSAKADQEYAEAAALDSSCKRKDRVTDQH
jgi:tetratricopeptide (TPR) repeat protein